MNLSCISSTSFNPTIVPAESGLLAQPKNAREGELQQVGDKGLGASWQGMAITNMAGCAKGIQGSIQRPQWGAGGREGPVQLPEPQP